MAAKDTLVHLWVLVEWDLWSKSMKSQILEGFRSFSERRNWLQLAENIFKYFSAPYSDANNLMISKKKCMQFSSIGSNYIVYLRGTDFQSLKVKLV